MVKQSLTSVALWSKFPNDFINLTIEKLFIHGFKVVKQLGPATKKIDLTNVDFVFFMNEMASHTEQEVLKNLCAKYNKKIFVLSRKVSAWSSTFNYLESLRMPTIKAIQDKDVRNFCNDFMSLKKKGFSHREMMPTLSKYFKTLPLVEYTQIRSTVNGLIKSERAPSDFVKFMKKYKEEWHETRGTNQFGRFNHKFNSNEDSTSSLNSAKGPMSAPPASAVRRMLSRQRGIRTQETTASVSQLPLDAPRVSVKTVEPEAVEPEDEKPIEVKPFLAKPIEVEPAEAKPVEAEPIEDKPADSISFEPEPMSMVGQGEPSPAVEVTSVGVIISSEEAIELSLYREEVPKLQSLLSEKENEIFVLNEQITNISDQYEEAENKLQKFNSGLSELTINNQKNLEMKMSRINFLEEQVKKLELESSQADKNNKDKNNKEYIAIVTEMTKNEEAAAKLRESDQKRISDLEFQLHKAKAATPVTVSVSAPTAISKAILNLKESIELGMMDKDEAFDRLLKLCSK